MPITRGAKKAHRASLRKHAFNLRRKVVMKEAVKEYKTKPSAEGLTRVFKALDKAAKRGVIKKQKANRDKSRLSSLLS